MALPPPPTDAHETVRVLTDGDLCDTRKCPATAYVRVYMYRNGDKDTLTGLLHFCGHHWRDVADVFTILQFAGRCSIRDEIEWIGS